MNLIGEVVGYLAGVLTAFCFLPQSIRIIKKKKVRALSFWSYLLYCLGILFWILYGIYVGSMQMIVFNAISLIFAGIILVMIIRYRDS